MAALAEDDSEAIPQQAINNEPSLSVAQLEGYQYEEMSCNNNMVTTLVAQCGSITDASVAPQSSVGALYCSGRTGFECQIQSNVMPCAADISLAELLNVDQEELPNGDQGYSQRIQRLLKLDRVEAVAATTSIKLAANSGNGKTVLEGDSKLVTDALKQGTSDLSERSKFLDQINSYIDEFVDYSVSWIQRDGNSVASYLAKFVKNCTSPCIWREDCSDFLLFLVQNNVLLST
ncbi:unnamed protein product [Ilex paraguariensis]|uniref:RNase H type-1 domain-containing protein n=1 Tax=Ilex paraguariensis TaxID=185542 RepID=A0ABC8SRW0_9AQUA